jgi:V/A-type H+-transporting ATPase subunit D
VAKTDAQSVLHKDGTIITKGAAGTGQPGSRPAGTKAASAFEFEIDAIIQLAETELRLTRLAIEIQSTSRRLNALEHFLIPRLESEIEFIQVALDERERSDHFRLKLVKRNLSRKRENLEALPS